MGAFFYVFNLQNLKTGHPQGEPLQMQFIQNNNKK